MTGRDYPGRVTVSFRYTVFGVTRPRRPHIVHRDSGFQPLLQDREAARGGAIGTHDSVEIDSRRELFALVASSVYPNVVVAGRSRGFLDERPHAAAQRVIQRDPEGSLFLRREGEDSLWIERIRGDRRGERSAGREDVDRGLAGDHGAVDE